MKTKHKTFGPEPLTPQPHWVAIECNDAAGRAELHLTTLGGERVHFSVHRDGKVLSSFAVTKGTARGIIMWLAAFA